MAVILISHDLGVVAGICNRVQVMYAGRIVESAAVEEVFYRPKHPYNLALQKSFPALQRKGQELYTIPGMPPDLGKRVEGCAFAPRCDHAGEICRRGDIRLRDLSAGHRSACVRIQNGDLAL
jgi:oligopeptide transport system ATP-binding protein